MYVFDMLNFYFARKLIIDETCCCLFSNINAARVIKGADAAAKNALQFLSQNSAAWGDDSCAMCWVSVSGTPVQNMCLFDTDALAPLAIDLKLIIKYKLIAITY